jgi:hypothetical protein
MKKRYLPLIILLCFSSCALFKKTSKTSNTASQTSSKQLEANMLVLKNANKETQVFTFWNDSGVYQFQHIKEQIDLVKKADLKITEKQMDKKQVSTSKAEAPKTWIYVGAGLMVIGCYFLYKKLSPR